MIQIAVCRQEISVVGSHSWNLYVACYFLSLNQAMVEAHDDIAAKNYEDIPDVAPIITPPPVSQHFPVGPPTDAIRMVGIRKTPEEPLVIAEILHSLLA